MSDALSRALTDAAVRNAKPNETPYKMTDGGGLHLLVQPTGSKLWRFKFFLNGREGLQSLGKYPDLSLSAARAAHRLSREAVAAGTNPVHAKRDGRQAAAMEALALKSGAFKMVVDEWAAITEPDLAALTIKQHRREIKKYLLPAFGTRNVRTIKRVEISVMLQAVEKRTPEVARNLRTYLESIFERAIDTGLLDANPCPPARVLKRRSSTPHAAMDAARLPLLFDKLAAYPGDPKTAAAFNLVVLTACRKNEILRGRWSEIDFKAAEWIIPAERMKGRRDHFVPLSKQAMAILRELRRTTNSDLIFPNRDDPERAMACRTLNAALGRMGFNGETMHGFRSVFSTHFNGLTANADVVERCLAHVPKDQVRAVYNRYQYRDERRVMLQAWGDWLDVVKKQPQAMAA